MASRYIRDTVILAKIETTAGTDSIPTGAANAMAISNVRMTPLNAQFVPRDLLRNYFGASEELLASYNKLVSFDVEAVGSGTAGTAPAWGPLLRACGHAQTVTATERVEYTPITNGQESVSIYVYDSGVLHKMVFCKGAFTLKMGLGEIPKFSFAFVAVDGGDSAATPSGVGFSDFRVPQVVNDQFTGDLLLGCTYTAAGSAPALTSGTAYPSTGLEIDMGIKAEYIPLLGGQSVEITDRKAKAKIKLDASAVQEVAFYTAIKAGTLQTLGLFHGTVAGDGFGVFAPAGQIVMPNKDELQGKRMMGYDVNLTPVAGNDEITIVTSF